MHLSTFTIEAVVAAASAGSFMLGTIAARLFGCAQCRAVRDQEALLVKRLLGDREAKPLQRHRLRRHRPYTAAEMIEVLLVNGVILTAERWQEIEDLHQRYGMREMPRHRSVLDEFKYDPDDVDEIPVPR
jgi:hypothetical protein